MIPKQDRIRPRTVEDLERKYNFMQMDGNTSTSLRSASEAREAASDAKEAASKAEASVANKVGRDEHDEIVRMLNKSTEKVVIESNRLVVESKQISLTEEGDVKQQTLELMRFNIGGEPYKLCMLVTFTIDEQYPKGRWVLVNQFIEPVEEVEEQEQE